jgi:hypothetical protein
VGLAAKQQAGVESQLSLWGARFEPCLGSCCPSASAHGNLWQPSHDSWACIGRQRRLRRSQKRLGFSRGHMWDESLQYAHVGCNTDRGVVPCRYRLRRRRDGSWCRAVMKRILDQKNPVKIKGWSDEYFLLPIRSALVSLRIITSAQKNTLMDINAVPNLCLPLMPTRIKYVQEEVNTTQSYFMSVKHCWKNVLQSSKCHWTSNFYLTTAYKSAIGLGKSFYLPNLDLFNYSVPEYSCETGMTSYLRESRRAQTPRNKSHPCVNWSGRDSFTVSTNGIKDTVLVGDGQGSICAHPFPLTKFQLQKNSYSVHTAPVASIVLVGMEEIFISTSTGVFGILLILSTHMRSKCCFEWSLLIVIDHFKTGDLALLQWEKNTCIKIQGELLPVISNLLNVTSWLRLTIVWKRNLIWI